MKNFILDSWKIKGGCSLDAIQFGSMTTTNKHKQTFKKDVFLLFLQFCISCIQKVPTGYQSSNASD